MNKTTVIMIVIAVVIIGLIMYQASVQAEKDRALQMQLAQMQGATPQSNIWSSLGDLSGLLGTIGGLFGGGKNDPTKDPDYMINPSTGMPYGTYGRQQSPNSESDSATPEMAVLRKQNYLTTHVDQMLFNDTEY